MSKDKPKFASEMSANATCLCVYCGARGVGRTGVVFRDGKPWWTASVLPAGWLATEHVSLCSESCFRQWVERKEGGDDRALRALEAGR